jgi:hypothetical protein
VAKTLSNFQPISLAPETTEKKHVGAGGVLKLEVCIVPVAVLLAHQVAPPVSTQTSSKKPHRLQRTFFQPFQEVWQLAEN